MGSSINSLANLNNVALRSILKNFFFLFFKKISLYRVPVKLVQSYKAALYAFDDLPSKGNQREIQLKNRFICKGQEFLILNIPDTNKTITISNNST